MFGVKGGELEEVYIVARTPTVLTFHCSIKLDFTLESYIIVTPNAQHPPRMHGGGLIGGGGA